MPVELTSSLSLGRAIGTYAITLADLLRHRSRVAGRRGEELLPAAHRAPHEPGRELGRRRALLRRLHRRHRVLRHQARDRSRERRPGPGIRRGLRVHRLRDLRPDQPGHHARLAGAGHRRRPRLGHRSHGHGGLPQLPGVDPGSRLEPVLRFARFGLTAGRG
ncbi:MAG: hypothetical protein MZV64_42865 [Ignavibacteriales bacterium]|nr:hypothetical protein [Ignavibacteriales bacterium]